jgi:hypothetical protein
MCKKYLRNAQMPSHDVARAQQWNDDLIRWEASGWGDAGNAMGRVSRRIGVPFAKLWALKYRPPKAIASHVLSALAAAHAAETQRQLRKLADDTALTALVAGAHHPAVAAAEAVLGASGGSDQGAPAGVVGPAMGPVPGSAEVIAAACRQI